MVVSGRDESALRSLADDVARAGGERRIETMPLDLASLQSVRECASALVAGERPPLRAIVCNAGIQIVTAATFTEDGYETTFAVNHLAHFLLVDRLLDHLASPARILFVASGVHDPANRTGMPAPALADARTLAAGEMPDASPATAGRRRYTTSKLCNVMCAYELDRRLRAEGRDGISVNAFDPGLMPGTGLGRDYTRLQQLVWRFVLPALRFLPRVNSPAAAGRSLARLVVAPELEGVSGRYFAGKRETRSSAESYDEAKAARLWEQSAELVEGAPAARNDQDPGS
jgi:NAD(P)-dependent dehydrogenase (short-subunit alcohol dehydrogenase family)